MRINKKWLPIKAHYFFFYAAMGPILPQLPVYGKELGISSVVMGTIVGILPFAFFLAKPALGVLVDVYRNYRKLIFEMLIVIMTLFFAGLYFIPPRPLVKLSFKNFSHISLDICHDTDMSKELECTNQTTRLTCTSNCLLKPTTLLINKPPTNNSNESEHKICSLTNSTSWSNSSTCDISCIQDIESDVCLYNSVTFWSFVLCMSIGSIGFNVVNSITDAICLDVLGEHGDYGKQRVWGTVGFGVTAFISGYTVDFFSGDTTSYAPVFIIMLVGSALDLIACVKLKLPVIEAPKNIFRDFKKMLRDKLVITFLTFAVFAGILDSLILFFLLWYLEDLAIATNTANIKLIEGLTIAAEALGGEIIFFSVSGSLLRRFGHVHCFSMCFFSYSLRFGLISLAPSPWWIIPIEFFLNGPCYALMYSTIVAYANDLAPLGASATMRGIAAGMDDGVGYAIGSIVAGLLLKYLGGKHTLQVFSAFAFVCGAAHLLLHKTILRQSLAEGGVKYKDPKRAYEATNENI